MEGTTQSEVAMRKSIALMNDAVIVVSERRKYLLPLVLIVTGSIWLSALVFQWTISPGVVWVLGGDYDFGKVPQGKIIEHRVRLFNPHTSMFEKSSFMRGKKQSISPFQDQPPKQQKT
jgi:hypothetical protein